jgi:hypothetical protein
LYNAVGWAHMRRSASEAARAEAIERVATSPENEAEPGTSANDTH